MEIVLAKWRISLVLNFRCFRTILTYLVNGFVFALRLSHSWRRSDDEMEKCIQSIEGHKERFGLFVITAITGVTIWLLFH